MGLGVATGVLGGRRRDGDTAPMKHVVTTNIGCVVTIVMTWGHPAIVPGGRGSEGPKTLQNQGFPSSPGIWPYVHWLVFRFNLIYNWNKLMALRLLLRSKVIAGQICCAR